MHVDEHSTDAMALLRRRLRLLLVRDGAFQTHDERRLALRSEEAVARERIRFRNWTQRQEHVLQSQVQRVSRDRRYVMVAIKVAYLPLERPKKLLQRLGRECEHSRSVRDEH